MADLRIPPLERVEIIGSLSEALTKLLALELAIDGLTHRLGMDADSDALSFILHSVTHDLHELHNALSAEHRAQEREP